MNSARFGAPALPGERLAHSSLHIARLIGLIVPAVELSLLAALPLMPAR
jgi:hypothetical protein